MSLKILSIDGGGTRGIIPATILNCIEKDFGQPVPAMFNLLAGTSSGGILCLALAAGVPASELEDLYLHRSKDIFREALPDKLQGLDEHFHASYSNKRFKKILRSMLGNKTLGDLQADPSFGGRNKNLMVCSFDLAPEEKGDRNRNYRPAVYHSAFVKHRNIKLTDLALMTSASPTYFPVHNHHIDGSVAMNNPSMAAVAFAINKHQGKGGYLYPGGTQKGLGMDLADLQLFSLGAGTGNTNRIPPSVIKSGNWGNLQWIKYLPELLAESNMQSNWYYVQQLLTEQQICRVELFFDDAKAPEILQKKPVGWDVTRKEAIKAMHDFALATYDAEKKRIADFLNR